MPTQPEKPTNAPLTTSEAIETKQGSQTNNTDTPKSPPRNEFVLTPLETLLLNKQMPVGFKLELEEILQKEIEEKSKPIVHKKHKKGFTFSSDYPRRSRQVPKEILPQKQKENDNILYSSNNNITNSNNTGSNSHFNTEKKSLRQHKPIVREDLGYIDKDVIKGKSNPLRAAVCKQCEKGISKLRKNPVSEFFYFSQGNTPSLSQIEKNIRNYKYKSIYEFIMDLRRIWNYYFSKYPNNPEINARTFEMSRYSEELYKEMEVLYEDKNQMTDLSKKIDSLAQELRDMKGSHPNGVIAYPTKKNVERTNQERVMTQSEKAALRSNINMLNKDQMRGLVKILADTIDMTKNKQYLEFDIDTLGNRKLRDIDHYVKNCLRREKRNHHQQANNAGGNPNNVNTTTDSKIQQLKSDLGDNSSVKKQMVSLNQNPNIQNNNSNNITDTKNGPILNNKENIGNEKIDDSSSESDSSSLSSL